MVTFPDRLPGPPFKTPKPRAKVVKTQRVSRRVPLKIPNPVVPRVANVPKIPPKEFAQKRQIFRKFGLIFLKFYQKSNARY